MFIGSCSKASCDGAGTKCQVTDELSSVRFIWGILRDLKIGKCRESGVGSRESVKFKDVKQIGVKVQIVDQFYNYYKCIDAFFIYSFPPDLDFDPTSTRDSSTGDWLLPTRLPDYSRLPTPDYYKFSQ